MNATDYIDDKIINTFLRGGKTFTASPIYVALYSTIPGKSDWGVEIVETGYSRTSGSGRDPDYSGIGPAPTPPPSTVQWFTVSNGIATNNYQIDFTKNSGGTSWLNINGLAIVSGSDRTVTGSQVYFSSGFANYFIPITIQTGSYLSIPEGNIKIELKTTYSIYLANKILNCFLNGVTIYEPGLNIKAALFNTMPDRDGTGGQEVESWILKNGVRTYTGYNRRLCSGTSFWRIPSSGSTRNYSLVDFGTAYEPWGVVVGMGIYDDAINQPLFLQDFNYPRYVGEDDTFELRDEMLAVKLT